MDRQKLRKGNMQTLYRVDKTSNTSADTLLAVGLASLLGDLSLIQHETQDDIFLEDRGSCFVISLASTIDITTIPDDKLDGLQIVLPLDSSRQREKQAKKGNTRKLDGFDYDQKMEDKRAYREIVRKLGPGFQTPEARLRKAPELQALSEPDTRLDHYQAINQMKIAGTFNELAIRWDKLTPEQKRLHLLLLFDLFHEANNDIVGTIAHWQKMAKEMGIKENATVSALQIINPTTGKGANRAKASELTVGNQDSFWLLELLKFRGFMEAAAPLLIRESDDRKTYVLQPRYVKLSLLQNIMKEFRAVFWPTTAVKMDILASLRFAQVVVEQYKTSFEHDAFLESWMSKEPASLAHDFEMTFYKYLGSAHATMNLATIGIPTWLPRLENLEQVLAAADVLDEHVQLVRNIRNSKGEEGAEEYELLRLYRDFLSGNTLLPFWKFTTAYSSYLIRTREKNPYIKQLSYKGLEQVIMGTQNNADAVAILASQGFQHIADAIRRSTVFAQYRRSQFDDRTYEVRYGLGQDLMRKARYGKEFTIALAEFLLEYNAETAREDEKAVRRIMNETNAERPRPLMPQDRISHNLRFATSEHDFNEVVTLINNYGSELVGSMLIACGYSFKAPTSIQRDTNNGAA